MLWLLKLINPLKGIAREIARVSIAKENADTEEKRIEAGTELGYLEARRDILLAEQANPITRLVRPMWAAPFIIWTWKVVVWDGVFGWGVTAPLSTEMSSLMMLIAGAYFVFRGSEKLIRMWRK